MFVIFLLGVYWVFICCVLGMGLGIGVVLEWFEVFSLDEDVVL